MKGFTIVGDRLKQIEEHLNAHTRAIQQLSTGPPAGGGGADLYALQGGGQAQGLQSWQPAAQGTKELDTIERILKLAGENPAPQTSDPYRRIGEAAVESWIRRQGQIDMILDRRLAKLVGDEIIPEGPIPAHAHKIVHKPA